MDFSTQIREGKICLEELIDAKKPHLRRWIPAFVLSYIKRIVHLDEVNATVAGHQGEHGRQFAENVLREMGVEYAAEGISALSTSGRYISPRCRSSPTFSYPSISMARNRRKMLEG